MVDVDDDFADLPTDDSVGDEVSEKQALAADGASESFSVTAGSSNAPSDPRRPSVTEQVEAAGGGVIVDLDANTGRTWPLTHAVRTPVRRP